MENITALIDRLSRNWDGPPMHCCGPVSAKALDIAENELGLRLPPSYREFVMKYGACHLFDRSIAGITPTRMTEEPTPEWDHIVDVNKELKRNDKFPDYFYLASNYGDRAYYFDASRCANNEYPIVAIGESGGFEDVAPSFPSLLEKLAARKC